MMDKKLIFNAQDMILKKLGFLISILFLINSCISTEKKITVRVATAASVQYVLEDLIKIFESQNDIKIEMVVSSSGKLVAQIEQGAPIDLFVSADTKYPDYLKEKSLIIGEPIVYAKGKLVLWTCKKMDLTKGLNSLLNPEVQKIAIADSITAPYGKLAVQALRDANIYPNIASKIVWGESISQVNQYVHTQVVELGLTAKSVVLSGKLKGQGNFIEIPNYSLDQSMVLIPQKDEAKAKAAKAFFDFLQSDAAKRGFQQNGYDVKM